MNHYPGASSVALVANDLSRLHRKGWRVGDLLDFVDEHDVKLLLAAPGKQMDFSTPQGRIFAQLSAIFDEWYAIDISQRYKDMIAHRKRQGKSVGRPPFGTRRSSEGYLEPTPEGAWYLPDGTFVSGHPDQIPDPAAVCRNYYEAAKRILTLYAEGKHGIEAIAYQLQIEGWPWRDNSGQPTVIEGDDVRRVAANWAEYGGFVSKNRARQRHPDDYPVEEIALIPERAVFDLDLLYRVGKVRVDRTIKHTANDGENSKSFLIRSAPSPTVITANSSPKSIMIPIYALVWAVRGETAMVVTVISRASSVAAPISPSNAPFMKTISDDYCNY